jgi:glycosyltransferase involved in cell wall biosynthesis
MTKALIAVLAADVAEYDKLAQAIKNTWGSIKYDDCSILYYYGYRNGYDRPAFGTVIKVGDDLICGIEENIDNINKKTRMAFEYIYNTYDFDYIFRCCSGCYVNQGNLINFLADKPKDKFYCGIATTLGGLKFASGAGYIISRDLVKLLIDNPSSFTCHVCDDVAIGKFLIQNGIELVNGQRQDIEIEGSLRISRRKVIPAKAQSPILLPPLDKSQYQYHFRHSVEAMHTVHKELEHRVAGDQEWIKQQSLKEMVANTIGGKVADKFSEWLDTHKTDILEVPPPRVRTIIKETRKRNNIMLHCNQAFWRGGTILFTKDVASVYPEFHHVCVYFHDNREDYSMMDEFMQEGIDVSKIDKLTEEIVAEINPVVMIFHNTPGELIDGAWPYGWLRKWPLIAMHHNTSFPAFYADLDVFVSRSVLAQYEKVKTRMNWRLIPPCIDLSAYTEIKRDKSNARCIIGKLTSNVPTRYPQELIPIFEKSQALIPECGFIIIGGADYYKDVKLNSCVMPKTGSAPPKEFYAQMDIFVHKNTKDTIDSWGRVISEAMASGLPVVVENRGGPSEQIKHGIDGFLCDTDDQFVEYIVMLARDPLLRYEVGMRAREKALREFGIDRFRRETSDIILKAALGVI